jgi:hypothetical protein
VRRLSLTALLWALLLALPGTASAGTTWVDPAHGSDRATGNSRDHALATLDAAWRRADGPTRIVITPGRLGPEGVPNYFEKKHGVIIEGRGRVVLSSLNIFGVRRLALRNLTVSGDVHCERCRGLHLTGVTIDGGGRVQEGLKVNQSSHVVIDRSDISGAYDNSIDLVAVHHVLIRSSRIHGAEDWCAYAKGGSAYIRVVGNRIYDCGTGGFTAGQGTGFQFMRPPWIRYEAYDVRVWNNLITDTEGAGLGVNGGFNILFARNTLLRVGSRSHAIEVVFGLRSCDGRPGDEGRERCQTWLDRGGWGTTRVDDGTNAVRIPNRHVFLYDNVISKASGAATFEIADDFGDSAQKGSGAPDPARADEDLRRVGNVVSHDRREGPAHPLPRFSWRGAGLRAPRPGTLSNRRLRGMPAKAGSTLLDQ